ncbi:unnamed protein product [Tuber aestivum]|uniref:Uncharacterized protein n=1 Tax=Tuber aestivum TaxID=59557 RepID=A0A292PRB1_9PEZI|nr:unnamed protein product [Tuber aestivum]
MGMKMVVVVVVVGDIVIPQKIYARRLARERLERVDRNSKGARVLRHERDKTRGLGRNEIRCQVTREAINQTAIDVGRREQGTLLEGEGGSRRLGMGRRKPSGRVYEHQITMWGEV